MHAYVRLSSLLLGLWSLQVSSQQTPQPEAPEKEVGISARGWNGQLPMLPAPPAPAVGTLLYFDFSTGIVLPEDCHRDVRQRGAYGGYFNGGTFGAVERCVSDGRLPRAPIPNTPPSYNATPSLSSDNPKHLPR